MGTGTGTGTGWAGDERGQGGTGAAPAAPTYPAQDTGLRENGLGNSRPRGDLAAPCSAVGTQRDPPPRDPPPQSPAGAALLAGTGAGKRGHRPVRRGQVPAPAVPPGLPCVCLCRGEPGFEGAVSVPEQRDLGARSGRDMGWPGKRPGEAPRPRAAPAAPVQGRAAGSWQSSVGPLGPAREVTLSLSPRSTCRCRTRPRCHTPQGCWCRRDQGFWQRVGSAPGTEESRPFLTHPTHDASGRKGCPQLAGASRRTVAVGSDLPSPLLHFPRCSPEVPPTLNQSSRAAAGMAAALLTAHRGSLLGG